MGELTLKERLKVYIAINPDKAVIDVNMKDFLALVKIAEEGEKALNSTRAEELKLRRGWWLVLFLSVWNLASGVLSWL